MKTFVVRGKIVSCMERRCNGPGTARELEISFNYKAQDEDGEYASLGHTVIPLSEAMRVNARELEGKTIEIKFNIGGSRS